MLRTPDNPFDAPDIAAGYESWYATTGQQADQLERALLKTMLAKVQTACTILEVGCGTGHFTRWFRSMGLETTGLDRSTTMLVEASRLGTGQLIHARAENLPFETDAFDLIAMITTLEFLGDPSQALAESKRVSRIGLLLGVINRCSWVGWQYRRQGGPIWDSACFYSPSELVALMQQAFGDKHDIHWRTTLWPFCFRSLPLPWGGFIGMLVQWLPEPNNVPHAFKGESR